MPPVAPGGSTLLSRSAVPHFPCHTRVDAGFPCARQEQLHLHNAQAGAMSCASVSFFKGRHEVSAALVVKPTLWTEMQENRGLSGNASQLTFRSILSRPRALTFLAHWTIAHSAAESMLL